MVQSGLHAARLRRYQAEPVGGTAELENDRVSWRNDDLAVDRTASVLRTRPPVDEEGEEIGCADVAVFVEVGWTAGVKALWFSNIHD